MTPRAHAARELARTVGAGAAIPVALGLLEVVRRSGGDFWLGAALALCLGTCVGAGLALLIRAAGRSRLAIGALHLAVPVLLYGNVIWAVDRFAELSRWAGTLSVWTLAFALALAAGVLLHRLVTRMPVSRVLRAGVAMAGLVICHTYALYALQAHSHAIARFVPHGFVLAFGGLVLWPRLERLTLAGAALAAALALQVLPARYLELVLIFCSIALTTSIASLRAWGVLPAPAPAPRVALAGIALVISSGIAAHAMVSRLPDSWATSRGQGFLTALVSGGQRLTDFDRDSHGMIFAQSDCGPLDPKINPGEHELPGNDADENCSGAIASASAAAWVRAQESLNPRPQPFRGDIVIILIDTLRLDAARDPGLPALAAFARDGLDFTRAYTTSSFTSFALAGMLAGKMPSSIGMRWKGPLSGVPAQPLHGLPLTLQKLGYDTAIAGGSLPEENEYFLETTFAEGFRVRNTLSVRARPELVEHAALEAWHSLTTTGPRFLYVHFLWVHEGEEVRARYLENAREVDRALGRLREHIGDEALWVVTADHGSEFGEHGGYFHASTLYEEVVRVPLFVLLPGAAPRAIHGVSPQRFLGPTLRAMIEPPRPGHERGPYLCFSPGPCSDLPVTMALELQDIHLHALVLGHSKIIHDVARETFTAFDLARDPRELTPLQPIPPQLLRALQAWEDNLYGATSPEFVWPYER